MNLLDLIFRQWRRRPTRTILSVLSVALAVAAVLGAAVAQTSVRSGSDSLRQFVDRAPALDVVAVSGDRIDAARLPRLGEIAGVRSSFPLASRATLTRAHGKRIKGVVVGLPLDNGPAWDELALTAGRRCQAADEIVLGADIAEQFEIKTGDSVTLLTRHGPKSATVVGLVDGRSLGEMAPGATAALPLATLDDQFSLGGQVDRLRVRLNSSSDRASVEAALKAQLPSDLQVQTAAAPAQMADTVLRSTELALKFSGALSLAMATFIILNTLRMNFAERRREIAILRVLGATQRQLVMLHLAEGATLGLIGALIGVPLGLALGRVLAEIMRRVVESPPAETTIHWPLVALCVVAGPVVAAIAAIAPAIQASRAPPSEAMTGAEPRVAEGLPRWATFGGAILMALACGLMLLVMTGRLPPELAIPGGILMLLAFIILIPSVIGPVAKFAAAILRPVAPLGADLAASQLLERRIRTGLTAGVLVVAVNASLGLGNAIINNVDDVRQWHQRWLTGDVSLVDPAVGDEGSGSADQGGLREEILKQPAAASIVEVRIVPSRVDGSTATCVIRDFLSSDPLPWALQAGDEATCVENLRQGQIVIGGVLARKLGLHLGDTARVEVGGRTIATKIAGIANDYAMGGLVVYAEREAAAKQISLGPPVVVFVHAKPGASTDDLVAQLRPIADRRRLSMESFAETRQKLDRMVNSIVGALWGLLAVGFLVGCAAVANALTMNVLEQTAEIGIMRVLGMTRTQVRQVVLCESLLLGVLGAGLGTIAGLVTAAIIELSNEPLLGHPAEMKFHPLLLAVNVGGCLLVALIAGWSPGAKAARLDLIQAIAHE